jgi:hypothetical protein
VSTIKHVCFIQGGGSAGAYDEDRALVDSLQAHLGTEYKVWYPAMPNEANPDFTAWMKAIQLELDRIKRPVFLVGHSIGASVLAKILSGSDLIGSKCLGLYLVAGPFWHDDAFWRWDECALSQDSGARMPNGLPIHLYHGEADPFVPIAHLDMYASAIPQAVVRGLPGRDHQLNEDLFEVARDIIAAKENLPSQSRD